MIQRVIIIVNETVEIIQELIYSLLRKYKKGLEESMKGSKFVFESVDLLHYKCHRISLNCNRLHIDSPKWLINTKLTINLKNNDGKYFQYAVKVALNHETILQKVITLKGLEKVRIK